MSTTNLAELTEKIRKLFNLADPSRGATEAEAKLAFQKARELMIKHGIESIDTEEKKDDGIEVTQLRTNFSRRQYYYDPYIAIVLIKCFGVRIIFGKYWNDYGKQCFRMTFVGTPEDSAAAKEFYEPLRKAYNHYLNAYFKNTGQKWTASVMRSYYQGLNAGFLQANAQALIYKNSSKNQVDRYAIVLANRALAVQKYYKAHYPKAKKVKIKRSMVDAHACEAGFRDGRDLDLTQKIR